jgi:hypothetical protein
MANHHDGRKWYQIRWFSPEDTSEERKLILKLDLLVVPYAFLAYWTKYIDQANISQYNCTIHGWAHETDSWFRQCLRWWFEGRLGLSWERIGSFTNNICGGRSDGTDSIPVLVHSRSNVLDNTIS